MHIFLVILVHKLHELANWHQVCINAASFHKSSRTRAPGPAKPGPLACDCQGLEPGHAAAAADRRRPTPPPSSDRCSLRPPTAAAACSRPRGCLPATCCRRERWAMLEFPRRPDVLAASQRRRRRRRRRAGSGPLPVTRRRPPTAADQCRRRPSTAGKFASSCVKQ